MISIQELHKDFDLLQDKTGSAYVEPAEKDRFFLLAQQQLLSEWTALRQDPSQNPEKTRKLSELLQPLFRPIAPFTWNGGLVTYASLENALGRQIRHLEEVSRDEVPCAHVRNSQWRLLRRMPLKNPTARHPLFRQHSGALEVLPTGPAQLSFTALLEPLVPRLGVQDVELHHAARLDLLVRALLLSGVPLRDQELMKLAATHAR
jgi:hypothetical protein